MDDADRAADLEEAAWADLERRIAARKSQAKPSRTHCQDCGAPLDVYRLAYDLCLTYAEEIKTKQHLWEYR